MPTFLQDLRFAFRTLRRAPGFSAVSILTLALGIGATSAIFSVVYAVLLRPLPYPQPDRLVMVWGWHPEIGTETASLPDFIDWRDQSRSFRGLAGIARTRFNLAGREETAAERIAGALVSHDFYGVMGVEAAHGRTPLPEEDVPGGERVVLLSHGLWERRFAADPGIVGETIELQGRQYTVVGVAREGFAFPAEAEVWTPLALDVGRFGRRADFLRVVGRLAPGLELGAAQSEMSAIMRRLEEEYPTTNAGWGVRLVPLHEQIVGDTRAALLAFLGAVGFVLLIACANVANLLLARASGRGHEMAVRAAIGAGRKRLVRQLLTESAALAVLGGAAGVALAAAGVRALVALAPQDIPRLEGVSVDLRILIFTLLVAVSTGFLFGLVPALRSSRADLHESLKEGVARSGGSVRRSRFRGGLVIAEVALSIVLLMGAGLLMRSFNELQKVEPGFQPDGVLTFRLSLPRTAYPDSQVLAFHQRLFERLSGAPGVTSVGAISSTPLGDGSDYLSFLVAGRPVPGDETVQDAQAHIASPGYFGTMGIPLREGRVFTRLDHSQSRLVAVINETMARRYFPDQDPLGQRITFGDSTQWQTIVGVVGDVHHEGLDSEPYPQVYTPHAQVPARSMAFVVRSRSDLRSLAAAVRRDVATLDPGLPVFDMAPMTQRFSDSIARPRFNSMLILIFAAVALTLAAVGLYGVMAQTVAERSREIGIRMALGAGQSAMLGRVLRDGARLAGLGGIVGLAAAAFLSRLLESLLFGVPLADPVTYSAVAAVLVVVACLASIVPALRASRVDPMVALRYE